MNFESGRNSQLETPRIFFVNTKAASAPDGASLLFYIGGHLPHEITLSGLVIESNARARDVDELSHRGDNGFCRILLKRPLQNFRYPRRLGDGRGN